MEKSTKSKLHFIGAEQLAAMAYSLDRGTNPTPILLMLFLSTSLLVFNILYIPFQVAMDVKREMKEKKTSKSKTLKRD